jgi:hypothetical protein
MNAPFLSRHLTFLRLPLLLFIVVGLGFGPSQAANTTDANRISTTLLTPNVPLGGPVTITWSIVPDGTPLPTFAAASPNPVSNLIARFDALHNVPAGDRDPNDLTNRPWFTAFRQLLNNFGRKTGITYVYVHDTDSTSAFTAGPAADRRGDVRIGGASLIGLFGYNNPPSGGSDMVLNTDGTLFSDSVQLKIVAAHEHAHGLGLGHVLVDNDAILSVVSGSGGNINGPQFDDLLALHRKYGDKYEKDGGNDTPATAVDLGTLTQGVAVFVGTDTNDLKISSSEEDFVSIDDDGDTDFFAVTLPGAGWLNVTLTPRGPSYSYEPEGGSAQTLDATSQSNLLFKVYNPAGTLLFTRNANGIGGTEELLDAPVGAGTYKVEVKGLANRTQMYRLRVWYDLIPAGAGVVITSTGKAAGNLPDLDMNVNIDGSGAASTPSPLFNASGSVSQSGAFGGIVGVTIHAMKNVSTGAATLGDELAAGTINRDDSGYLGVVDDPNGGGIGADAVNREGLQLILDELSGIDPSLAVRISAVNVQNVGRDGTDPVGTESFTIVNLATRRSAEFVPASGTAGMFDVSALDLTLPGGGSGAVAAIFSGDTGGFRIAGLMLEVISYVPPANYATWAIDNNIPGEPASGDFDQDGLTNFMEYALGLDPASTSDAPGTFDGHLLSFTKSAEARINGDVIFEIEQTLDFSGWQVVVFDDPDAATISYALPVGVPKAFARLKVTQVP